MLVQLSTLSTILFSVVLTSLGGFEPSTYGLEGRCSIQLSYRLNLALLELSLKAFRLQESGWWESNPRIQLGRLVFYHWTTPAYQSGWQDSNLRPPGPKPGALAKLSHTPFLFPCRYLRDTNSIIHKHHLYVNNFFKLFSKFFIKVSSIYRKARFYGLSRLIEFISLHSFKLNFRLFSFF